MRLSPNAVPRERVGDEKDDRVIRERRFKIGANLDIEDLGIGEKSEDVADSNHPIPKKMRPKKWMRL